MEHRIDLYETGLEDSQGREILKGKCGDIYKIVAGTPYTVTTAGEPKSPVPLYNLLSKEEALGYDPDCYPNGFDPELYRLEERKVKWQNGLGL